MTECFPQRVVPSRVMGNVILAGQIVRILGKLLPSYVFVTVLTKLFASSGKYNNQSSVGASRNVS